MKTNNIIKQQHGFLLITLLILIVVIGFLGIIIAQLVVGEQSALLSTSLATQSLYTAESGSSIAAYHLVHPTAVNNGHRLLCDEINSTTTSGSINANIYTLSGERKYSSDPVHLAEEISDTDTVIPIDQESGEWNDYALDTPGRIIIDHEMIDYKHTSESDALCGVGQAPCFYGATRGVANTTAKNHDAGRTIFTNMCELTITGMHGSETHPAAKKIIHTTIPTLEEGFAIGNNTGLKWDGQSWSTWAGLPAADYKDMAHIANDDIWIAGTNGITPIIYQWDGELWTSHTLPEPSPNTNYTISTINGISCLNHNNCLAVGDATQNSNAFAFHWDGSVWSLISIPDTPIDFKKVATQSDHYTAIGTDGTSSYFEEISSNGVLLSETLIDNTIFNQIKCLSDHYCIAVGNNGAVTIWNGEAWIDDNAPININLTDVSCTDTDNCWITANSATTILHRSGDAQYTSHTNPTGNPLYHIQCNSDDNCWAMGDQGAMTHFDGKNWSSVSPVTAADLNSLYFTSAPTQEFIGWHQA